MLKVLSNLWDDEQFCQYIYFKAYFFFKVLHYWKAIKVVRTYTIYSKFKLVLKSKNSFMDNIKNVWHCSMNFKKCPWKSNFYNSKTRPLYFILNIRVSTLPRDNQLTSAYKKNFMFTCQISYKDYFIVLVNSFFCNHYGMAFVEEITEVTISELCYMSRTLNIVIVFRKFWNPKQS